MLLDEGDTSSNQICIKTKSSISVKLGEELFFRRPKTFFLLAKFNYSCLQIESHGTYFYHEKDLYHKKYSKNDHRCHSELEPCLKRPFLELFNRLNHSTIFIGTMCKLKLLIAELRQ